MGRTHHTSIIRTGTVRHTTTRLLVAALASAALLAACSSSDNDDSASEPLGGEEFQPAATEAAAMEASAETITAEAADMAATETVAPSDAAPPGRSDQGTVDLDPADTAGMEFGTIGRDVIVELHVQMESDDIARSVAAITADVVTVGGGVASSDVSYGTTGPDGEPNRDGHAVLVLKVPPAEVGNVVGNLNGTGTVITVNQSAKDVTEQLIDLDVRIANKRESVENVRNMMQQATNLNDLVYLESELTLRQTELEQLEAQQRNLSERVALSTITVEIRPTPAPPEPEPTPEPVAEEPETIGDAFHKGWDAFGKALFGIGFVLAALAPFIVTGLVLAFFAWIAVRIRNRPRRAAPVPEQADTRDDELTPV